MKKEENKLMESIISLCKRRGFVYQGSEEYGGLAEIGRASCRERV